LQAGKSGWGGATADFKQSKYAEGLSHTEPGTWVFPRSVRRHYNCISIATSLEDSMRALLIGLGGVVGSGALATGIGWLAQVTFGF
jgi:hypothetical protein